MSSSGADGLKSSILNAIFNKEGTSGEPTTSTDSASRKKMESSRSEGDITAAVQDTKTETVSDLGFKEQLDALKRDSSMKVRKTDSLRDCDIEKSTMIEWFKACRKDRVEECKKMLKKNKDLVHLAQVFHSNYTCVHVAVRAKSRKLLEMLCQFGADINATTLTGYTALHLAAQSDDSGMVNLLVSMGADEKVKDVLGYTYHHYASWIEDKENISWRASIEPTIRIRAGRRPASLPVSLMSMDSDDVTRHGSLRQTIRGVMRIPSGKRNRCPSE